MPLEPDIHAHGFDSISGVVTGRLLSHFYDMETALTEGPRALDGEGYTGYLNTSDISGGNRSQVLTEPTVTVPVPNRVLAIRRGEYYVQRKQVDYHRVAANGLTVTIFAKTPSYFDSSESRAYVFRAPGHIPPPESY